MTNQDARVAEAVGYQYKDGYWIWPDGQYAPGVPPFISAPTADTDQIVLEWVQGQEHWLEFGTFLKQMKKFYMNSHDDWVHENEFIGFSGDDMPDSASNWFVMHLHYYKLGMYARALLAVGETHETN